MTYWLHIITYNKMNMSFLDFPFPFSKENDFRSREFFFNGCPGYSDIIGRTKKLQSSLLWWKIRWHQKYQNSAQFLAHQYIKKYKRMVSLMELSGELIWKWTIFPNLCFPLRLSWVYRNPMQWYLCLKTLAFMSNKMYNWKKPPNEKFRMEKIK